ncbi:hypothetical protein E8E12_009985 [Didymella heteroderae]|uniref:Uncharacterized protein n=1 Tax=Didymella heteroderae TaxID=1769908 RepID=A0A9P5C2I5_9PLEO|nr:hypothetical protein E8E12_009985 [Didymella heteroderae]
MKGLSLFSLLAADIIAVPAPPSDSTELPLTKNRGEYNFELYIKEYCNIDPTSIKPEVHAYAEFSYGDGFEYGWAFEKPSAKTFALDDIFVSVRHDGYTSGMSFESGHCKWKDGDAVHHRTLTCHVWHKTTPGSAPLLLPPPGKSSHDAAAGTIEGPEAPADVNVATDSLDASALKARDITGDGKTPDNLYCFSVTHSEWCENGALKARGWLWGRELNFSKDVTQKIPINLHPGRDLLVGPYSYDQHAFGIEYEGCSWTSEGGWPCGWCEAKPWTLGALNCQTLQPGYQRTSYRTCYFVDKHIDGKARRDVESLRTSSLPDNTTLSLLTTPVITAPARLIDINQADTKDSLEPTPILVDAETATITLMPQIIKTVLPNTPKGQEDLVFPFHIQVWEYCFSGRRLAAGVWRNGNMAQSLNFTGNSDKLNIVQTEAKGMFQYNSIDFDFEASRVKFEYPWVRGEQPACEWFDNESWKSCGECREKLWSSSPLDCEDPLAVGMRVKDMDCSLLLVKEQMFKLDPL